MMMEVPLQLNCNCGGFKGSFIFCGPYPCLFALIGNELRTLDFNFTTIEISLIFQ